MLKTKLPYTEQIKESEDKLMNIYFDNGKTVKIYPVKVKVAKAVMTLLEADEETVCCRTNRGYGIAIVNKEESKIKNESSNEQTEHRS